MQTNVSPRKNDDLKLLYALKDANASFVDLSGSTITVTMEYPDATTTTADSYTIVPSPTTYNLQVDIGKAKMTQEGWHRVQVKITFPDTKVRRSEIDRFFVQGNVA
jgi:hypothetical protein